MAPSSYLGPLFGGNVAEWTSRSVPAPAVCGVDLSVVIPCYNEEELVDRLVQELDGFVTEFRRSGKSVEVIVVDDGSTDRTFSLLEEAASSRPYLRLVRFRRNFGQTAAMTAGFEMARGEVIVPMDADLQNDPADIPKLLAKLDEGYDVVSGWRKDRKDTFLTRKLPSAVANRLVSWAGGLRLHDYGCTLKAYRRDVLEPVRLYGEMHRFIPIYAKWAGARVTEIPVNHRPRTAGRSKYNLGRTFKVLMDLVTLKFLGDFSTKPLYMFGGLGTLFCLGGIAAGITTLVQKYTTGAWVHKNPLLLLAVFLFLVGMMMFSMGLLAELLVRVYHESQGKPTYLVRETRNFGERSAHARGDGPVPAGGLSGPSDKPGGTGTLDSSQGSGGSRRDREDHGVA